MKKFLAVWLSVLLLLVVGCAKSEQSPTPDKDKSDNTIVSSTQIDTTPEIDNSETNTSDGADTDFDVVDPSFIPEYSGQVFIALNDNIPSFSKEELTTTGYEKYGELDSLGRVTAAVASVGRDTMPDKDEERGDISKIKPTGWVQEKYDCVSGKYLYNRCHLIGWQLSAENANKKNLITGTRFFNTEGMLPFENMVADYIKETDNHVAYRVTPVFDDNNLLCRGVQIEAFSVEDNGEGVCFNVFCYNIQPNIEIDYTTGESRLK